MTINSRRNIIELKEIRETPENLEELVQYWNESIVELNFILRSLTISNLDGELKTVTINAGETLKVNHRLKLIPKYKIILKQQGGGVILDGDFTRNYIELNNTGSDMATVTVLIVKD